MIRAPYRPSRPALTAGLIATFAVAGAAQAAPTPDAPVIVTADA